MVILTAFVIATTLPNDGRARWDYILDPTSPWRKVPATEAQPRLPRLEPQSVAGPTEHKTIDQRGRPGRCAVGKAGLRGHGLGRQCRPNLRGRLRFARLAWSGRM